MDRVEKGSKQGTILAVLTATTITGIILLLGKMIMGIFTTTTELVELAYGMMTIIAAGYICVAITQSLSGVMRGAGDTMTPMWISLVSTILIRVPLAYIMVHMSKTPENPSGSPQVLFLSLLIAWVSGALITVLFYLKGAWKKKAL